MASGLQAPGRERRQNLRIRSFSRGARLAASTGRAQGHNIGNTINVYGHEVKLMIADVNVGILYLLSITSLGVYGVTLAGWSSNNKYSLLGGLRSSAQMISYELSMGLSIIGVLMVSGTLRLDQIVLQQTKYLWGWMPAWNFLLQPVAFITFVVAAFAETNRLPFDLPEAEPELVGGYHTEYSGLKFGLFFLAEFSQFRFQITEKSQFIGIKTFYPRSIFLNFIFLFEEINFFFNDIMC